MERIFARFGCSDCSASFHAQHGPQGDLREFRCEQCDDSKLVDGHSPSSCSKCGGAMKEGLEPMCPRCRSRNTLVLVPGMFFE